MRRITVELDEPGLARLRELAEHERRDLRQQASWELTRALSRRRPPHDRPEPEPEPVR